MCSGNPRSAAVAAAHRTASSEAGEPSIPTTTVFDRTASSCAGSWCVLLPGNFTSVTALVAGIVLGLEVNPLRLGQEWSLVLLREVRSHWSGGEDAATIVGRGGASCPVVRSA